MQVKDLLRFLSVRICIATVEVSHYWYRNEVSQAQLGKYDIM